MGFSGGFSNEATYDMHLDIQGNSLAKRAYYSALMDGMSVYSLANHMKRTITQYFNVSSYTINQINWNELADRIYDEYTKAKRSGDYSSAFIPTFSVSDLQEVNGQIVINKNKR